MLIVAHLLYPLFAVLITRLLLHIPLCSDWVDGHRDVKNLLRRISVLPRLLQEASIVDQRPNVCDQQRIKICTTSAPHTAVKSTAVYIIPQISAVDHGFIIKLVAIVISYLLGRLQPPS
jgi:hypothetical protein